MFDVGCWILTGAHVAGIDEFESSAAWFGFTAAQA
jgi:hypothetical protein